jgi:hypothetical protein
MNGHSTDWCFDNPYRTGGPPIPTSRTWWCDSRNSYGHTSDTCWAKNPSPNSKGKGKPSTPKGKGNKGQQGDRKWKSPNFPAAYSTEQATPALHDESPSKHTTDEWWEGKDIGSSCFESNNESDQAANLDNEYDDAEIAEEIDFHFLAIIQNQERQNAYLLAPTAEKLFEFNEHEGSIVLAASFLNVHSQRIVRTFREQIGYLGCMDAFLANRNPNQAGILQGLHSHETKPAIEHNSELEIDAQFPSDIPMNRLDGLPVPADASSCLGLRDREVNANPLLVGGLVLDLAGQASPDDMDMTLSSTGPINILVDRDLETQLRARQHTYLERRMTDEICTHLQRESDIATVNALIKSDLPFIPIMKFVLDIHSHSLLILSRHC